MVGGILSGISDLAMTSKYEKSHRVDTPDVKQPEMQKTENAEEPKKESVNKSEEVKQEDEEQDAPNLALGRNIL